MYIITKTRDQFKIYIIVLKCMFLFLNLFLFFSHESLNNFFIKASNKTLTIEANNNIFYNESIPTE